MDEASDTDDNDARDVRDARAAAIAAERAARRALVARNDGDNGHDGENNHKADLDTDGDANPGGDAEVKRKQGAGAVTSWTKSLILATAIIVIGAFAWYAGQRFIGPAQWIVKFSVIAWLIGMGMASAMLSASREGAIAKTLAGLTAIIAIVLGKALILAYPVLPPELMLPADPAQWARAFARLAFQPIDGLFAALAIMGCAARFILSERE
jgi:hypothetical protein